MMSDTLTCDLIVIGCGPAGMAAAIKASNAGLSVVMLDDQPDQGGQVYRQIGKNRHDPETFSFLGPDYFKGSDLATQLEDSGIERIHHANVWQITEDKEVFYSKDGKASSIRARFILLAGGAQERPMPIPGWTLPGVMTVGAAQTLLKTSASGADGAVFIGTGPLFYLTIWQYLRAGFRIKAVLDTSSSRLSPSAILWAVPALLKAGLIARGLVWLREIRKKTAYQNGVSRVRLGGNSKLETIRFVDRHGRDHEIQAEHAFLHQGVVPNVNLGMATGLDHHWDERQLCWSPITDANGESSQKGIFVAGDGCGIAGASAAVTSGQLAAARIIRLAGRAAQGLPVFLRARHWLNKAPRPFLDRMFRPPEDWLVPEEGGTIICRCEGLSKDDIAKAVELGVAGPNQLKSYCRAGMGRCQARMCGLTVQQILAKTSRLSAREIGYFRLRPPVRPVTVGELAMLSENNGNEN
jgi:thioredoxin reductase/bacterioferritin-associated ferredoxin